LSRIALKAIQVSLEAGMVLRYIAKKDRTVMTTVMLKADRGRRLAGSGVTVRCRMMVSH
jgi:hypothetical protein